MTCEFSPALRYWRCRLKAEHTHAGQREFQKAHIFLPGFAGLARSSGKLSCEDWKIVGRPTVFGKPAGCGKRPAIRYTQAVLGACAS